jgi:hypothetical protein
MRTYALYYSMASDRFDRRTASQTDTRVTVLSRMLTYADVCSILFYGLRQVRQAYCKPDRYQSHGTPPYADVCGRMPYTTLWPPSGSTGVLQARQIPESRYSAAPTSGEREVASVDVRAALLTAEAALERAIAAEAGGTAGTAGRYAAVC